jgi:uncharacterized damage-inducible protein DinB
MAGVRSAHIQTLRALPDQLQAAVSGLSGEQLDTPYREGGWTVRQVVHHVADSHANSYVRFKLALTEEWPTIKPYDEAAWAYLADSRSMPIEPSLSFIGALHARWVALLESLDAQTTSSVATITPKWAVKTLLRLWHSMHGTPAMTPPTSPICARA